MAKDRSYTYVVKWKDPDGYGLNAFYSKADLKAFVKEHGVEIVTIEWLNPNNHFRPEDVTSQFLG